MSKTIASVCDSKASLSATGVSRHIGLLDPVRVCLTVLVIFHHTAITYGGSGSWYFRDADSPEWLRVLLSMFTATNQAFFMGFFFLLAGYFTPGSLARKGAARFSLDRLLRLGLPVLAFAALLSPMTRTIVLWDGTGDLGQALSSVLVSWRFDAGPLWFCIALLIFSAVWLGLARLRVRVTLPDLAPHWWIGLMVLGVAVLSFGLRLWMPVGKSLFGLQLGYFSSYIVLFAAGALMAKAHWLTRIDWRLAGPWVCLALVVFPGLWIYAMLGGAFDGDFWRGGVNLPALAYAFWEPFVAAGAILGCLAFFRRFTPAPASIWRRLADGSFPAFVIHPPVVVGASLLVRSLVDAAWLKFLLAGLIACVLSFALAACLPGKRAPGLLP